MNKIKIGIIGCGRIGKKHADTITNNIGIAEVYAVADAYMNDETFKTMENLGVDKTRIFKNVDDLLKLDEIDAVIIGTPTNTHMEIIEKAFAKKKHVFCEKPVSSSIEDMVKINKLLETNKLLFQVGFNRRYDHNFKAMKEQLKSKKFGDLYMLTITSFDPSPPPLSYVKVCGGIYKDMTIHDFDMARFLSGEEVDEVFAYGGALINKDIKGIDVDVTTVSMKLKSGALVVIHNSRKAIYGYEQTALALCDKGMIKIENDKPNTMIVATENGTQSKNPLNFFMDRYTGAYKDEIIEFVDLINSKSNKSLTTNNDCLQAVRIAAAALKSLKSGMPVKVGK